MRVSPSESSDIAIEPSLFEKKSYLEDWANSEYCEFASSEALA